MKTQLLLLLSALFLPGCGEQKPGPPSPLGPGAQFQVEQATKAMAAGRIEKGYGHLKELLKKDPPHVEVQHLAGLAASKLRRYGEAATRLQDAVDRNPQLWPKMTELGFTYENLGDLDRAKMTFRKVLDADPSKKRAAHGLGLVLLEQGELDEARKTLQAILERDPSYFQARYQLARVLSDLRLFDEALGEVDRVVTEKPSHEQALYLRATLLARLDRVVEAEEALQRRQEVYSKKETIAGLLDQTLHGRDTAQVHLRIARLYLKIGDRKEALVACRVGLQRFPGNVELSNILKDLREDP